MSDLTKILRRNEVTDRVNACYEKAFTTRTHLGLSQAGNECDRFLWYKHNKYIEPAPEGRILRLFELGNSVEDLVVKDLRQAGYMVSGTQKSVVFEWDDVKITGHIDGLIEGITSRTHLLEIKSCNDKQFKILLKKGYCEWHSTYKFQIMAYMLGFDKINLDRCLVVVYNKNTSELYTERISLDKEWIVKKLKHVFEVISSDIMPDRKCPCKSWWKSRFCPLRNTCFG